MASMGAVSPPEVTLFFGKFRRTDFKPVLFKSKYFSCMTSLRFSYIVFL